MISTEDIKYYTERAKENLLANYAAVYNACVIPKPYWLCEILTTITFLELSIETGTAGGVFGTEFLFGTLIDQIRKKNFSIKIIKDFLPHHGYDIKTERVKIKFDIWLN